jgi:hypothetical protein
LPCSDSIKIAVLTIGLVIDAILKIESGFIGVLVVLS